MLTDCSSLHRCRKLNFANPATGAQKSFSIDDDRRTRIFWDKRMSQEVEIDALGDEFKGYVVRIGGGNDKQGFPMKQGEQNWERRPLCQSLSYVLSFQVFLSPTVSVFCSALTRLATVNAELVSVAASLSEDASLDQTCRRCT